METKTKIIITLFIVALLFAVIAVYLNVSSSNFKPANPVIYKKEVPLGNPVGALQLSIEPYTAAPNTTGAGK